MSTCHACATELPDGSRFCLACGAGQVAPGCVSCGVQLPAGARFCLECGTPQPGAHPAPAAGAASGPATPLVARRVTSVLFGDLVGFTSLSESRDQEDVRELLSAYFEECRQIIGRYGGTVEKFIGDAVMAVWGVPTSHEDDAERAVRAGLELVSAVEAMGADVGVSDLAMRVGIVTGEVAVTIGAEAQGMVAGDAVNTASRVQSAAAPGQIWVDETTRLLTSSAISYVDVGSHTLRGKVEPIPLWAVRAVVAGVGGSQRADGLEAPLVGRDRELRLVKEIFHGIEDSRRPALLVVDGEAGVGKTRLGWEFEKYVDGLNSVARWHAGRCLAYGEGVAYYALAEAIRARLQGLAPEEDGTEDQTVLLELGLDRYVNDPAEREWLAPRLGALLGIGAVGSHPREDLFSAWTTFLRRTGEDEHPVVLVIDDAQHADDSLLQFLEYLLSVGAFGCLVLLLTRPGLLEENPALATNRRATVLHLEALSEPDVGRLLDGLVAGLPETVRASLIERSDGVPLFAVETVRSLIDRDLVVPRGGQYVLEDPDRLDLDAVGAPASLQALLSARLDTLDPDQRRLVDRASVIGDAFDQDQIERLCPEVRDVEQVLAGLVRLQLLRRESSRFTTEHGQYQFMQGAVRQVAYGTLSRHDRKLGHLAVVDVLQPEGTPAGELAPIIAQHLLEALDAVPDAEDQGRLTARAIEALQEAAVRAGALGAPREAAGHLEEALSRSSDPATGAVIERNLADVLDQAGSGEDSVRHAEHATATFDTLGDAGEAGLASAVWGRALLSLGRYDQATQVCGARLEAVRAIGGLPEVELALLRVIVAAKLRLGEDLLRPGMELARLAEFLGDRSMITMSFGMLSVYFQRTGARSLGRLLLDAEADSARADHDNVALARVLCNLNADFNCENTVMAQEYGEEAVTAARSVGDRVWISVSVINLLLAMALRGRWDEALALAEDPDQVSDLDAPYLELVRLHVLRSRGLAWTPGPGYLRQGEEQDEASSAVRSLIVAIEHGDAGQRDAARQAVTAARQMVEYGGLFDDFGVLLVLGVDLATELDDTEALAELIDLVDQRPRTRPPDAARFGYHWARALLGSRNGADPEQVEADFHTALADAQGWHSEPWVARANADLGVWLSRAGREEDAAGPLRAARETFERLGATRWSEQLEASLAGVRA
ncbi:adenylate/guanylate cyclase domain-containing protein [Nocardioides sp.]|uniref:adenylate/guanylate cyclase domain-containing protein n=1 Tax=Nocardioides sp. TaxID=35761 RepID=UPI002ED41583